MFDFCAICMHKSVLLVELSIERRRLLEAIVSPLMDLAALKPCRLLLCCRCNEVLLSMRKFQQTVFKGMMNLIDLHKHHLNEMSSHALPDVINDQSDLLLPVANQETVHSSETLYCVKPGVSRNAAECKPEDVLYCTENIINILPALGFQNAKVRILPENAVKTLDQSAIKNPRNCLEKPVIKQKIAIFVQEKVPMFDQPQTLDSNDENSPSASLSLESESKRDRYSHSNSRKEALDSAMTVLCDSDFDNPDIVPGYERVVSTSNMNDHWYAEPVLDNPDSVPYTRLVAAPKMDGHRQADTGFDNPDSVPYTRLVAAPKMNGHRHATTGFGNPDTVPCERVVAASIMNEHLYAESAFNNPDSVPYKRLVATRRKNGHRHADTNFDNPDSVPYKRLVATRRKNGHRHADTGFGNPDSVPYKRLVAGPKMNGHRHADTGFGNTDTAPACGNRNDIAVFVPLRNTCDKRIYKKSIESSDVENTKVMGKLCKRIKLALEVRSILESESPKPALESTHALDSFSTHELDKKSTHVLDSNSKNELNSKSSHELDSKSTHDIDSFSTHDVDSFSTHDVDSFSTHGMDSESTLSCQSDYEDAERFPNIVFAKAFNSISEDGENDVSEDIMKKLHVVTNPPSEWPCTWERCYQRHSSEEDCSDDSYDDSDSNRSNVNWTGRRRREDCKKCKLCDKKFDSLYRLWKHYEREHVDICVKECCNGTELKNHTKRHLKVTGSVPSPQFSCRECGYNSRISSHLKLHLATQRHRLRSQWRFQCDICKRKFKDKKGIAEHIEREHVAKEAKTCPICSVAFRSARALHLHAAAHVLAQESRALALAGVHRAHVHVHGRAARARAPAPAPAVHASTSTPTPTPTPTPRHKRTRTLGADLFTKMSKNQDSASPLTNGSVQKRPRKQKQNPSNERKRTQNPGNARGNTCKRAQNAGTAREPTQNPGNARKTTQKAVNARKRTQNPVNARKPTQNAVNAREPTQNPGNARKPTQNEVYARKPTQNEVYARKPTQNAVNTRKLTPKAVHARKPTQNEVYVRKPTQNAVNARKRTQNARNVGKRKATRRVVGDEEYEDERTAARVADMMKYLKSRTWVEAEGVLDFFKGNY